MSAKIKLNSACVAQRLGECNLDENSKQTLMLNDTSILLQDKCLMTRHVIKCLEYIKPRKLLLVIQWGYIPSAAESLGSPALASEARPAFTAFPGLLHTPFNIIREVTAARGNKAISKININSHGNVFSSRE